MPRFSFKRFIVLPLAILCGVSSLALLSSYLMVMSGRDGNALFPADCAMVFGAAVYGYDVPGPAIVRRVSTAVDLVREGRVERLILTGGVGRGTGVSASEASVMRTEAMRQGIPSDKIVMEEQSHTTDENLLFSRPLAKTCKSVVGVSDGYHLSRIRLLAWQQGWENFTVAPTELTPPAASETRSIIREVFAFLYYGLHIREMADLWGWDPTRQNLL